MKGFPKRMGFRYKLSPYFKFIIISYLYHVISRTESKKIVQEKLKDKEVNTMMTVRHPLERIISLFNNKFSGGTIEPGSVFD